jgi:hypothetical protein
LLEFESAAHLAAESLGVKARDFAAAMAGEASAISPAYRSDAY